MTITEVFANGLLYAHYIDLDSFVGDYVRGIVSVRHKNTFYAKTKIGMLEFMLN